MHREALPALADATADADHVENLGFFFPGLSVNVCTRNDEINAECFRKPKDGISAFVNETFFG